MPMLAALVGWTGLVLFCANFILLAYADVSARRLFKRLLNEELLDEQLLSEASAANSRRFIAGRTRLRWLMLRRGKLPGDMQQKAVRILMADRLGIGTLAVLIAMWFAGPVMHWL
jgi:hypothetical protein